MSESIHDAAETVRAEGEQGCAQGGFKADRDAVANPFARRVRELRRALFEAVSEEDMTAIIRKLVAMAKDGNVHAAKLILSYTLGRPQKALDPDRIDLHEWEIHKETAPMFRESGEISKTPSPQLALELSRMLRPVMAEIQWRQFKGMVDGKTPEGKVGKKQKDRHPTGTSGTDEVSMAERLRVGPSLDGGGGAQG